VCGGQVTRQSIQGDKLTSDFESRLANDAWARDGVDDRPEDDPQMDRTAADVASDAAADDDEAAERALDEAARGHRELSGGFQNHGRRRGNHSTGYMGRGLRGLRISEGDTKRIAIIRPTGRQLGAAAPAVGRPSFEDAPELVAGLLGSRRVKALRVSLAKKGATTEERQVRAYLAVMLRYLGSTEANRAAAQLLLGATDGEALRKIGDLRRRKYAPELTARVEQELRSELGRRSKQRRPTGKGKGRRRRPQTT
jgi:hypothetical protein